MRFFISKRGKIRILSFTLAAFVTVFGFWTVDRQHLKVAKRQINHHYAAALDELSSGIDTLALTLEKSKYISTPAGFCTLAGEVALQSTAVESAISSLPLSGENTAGITKFVTQVGDFALALSKKTAKGESLTQKEREDLSELSSVAGKLSGNLQNVETLYNSYENWDNLISGALKGVETADIGDSFAGMEEVLSDTPSLIYDGPFSDHITEKSSLLLESAKGISLNEAREKALEILKVSSDSLERAEDESGNMPSFIFESENDSIGITKKGGYVTYFTKNRSVGKGKIDYEKAVLIAKNYVNSLGLGKFADSYYMTDEGVCTVNFALVKDNVICYTDLIKVGVALDNGEILLYEARGYIMNHKERDELSPTAQKENAIGILNSNLQVLGVATALIPSDGLEEILCFEFYCKGENDEEILVYINGETLAEERILILLKTDGGTLTK